MVPRVRIAPGQGPRPKRRREAALRAELERLKAENRELKRRRRDESDAAPSTHTRRPRRAVSYEEDPDFEL